MGQKLEFRVAVGEWNVAFCLRFFNAYPPSAKRESAKRMP